MAENTDQQQELEKAYGSTAKKILTGVPRENCIRYFIKKGVPPEYAEDFVDKVIKDTENFKKSPGYRKYLINTANQRLITGSVWLIMAVVVSLISVTAAAAGFSMAMFVFGLAFLLFGLYSWIMIFRKK